MILSMLSLIFFSFLFKLSLSCSISELIDLVTQLEYNKQDLQNQITWLEERAESLLQEVMQERENKQKIIDLEEKIQDLENNNTELLNYIQYLEGRDCCSHCDSFYSNKGQTLHEASYTQKQRKIRQIKTNAEKALRVILH